MENTKFKNYYKSVSFVAKEHFNKLTLLFTFFILTVTISNLAYNIFEIKLLPFFETAFDKFRDFCYSLLDLLVFSWVTYVLEALWYFILYISSYFLDITPQWPKFIIPKIVSDIAFVSLALTRSFNSTDLIIPKEARENARKEMTDNDWAEIRRVEGTFWYFIHRCIEHINEFIWAIVNTLTKITNNLFQKHKKVKSIMKSFIMTLAATVLMWGYVRFIGYTINVIAAGHLQYPIMKVRKQFFKYFIIILTGAIIGTLLFFILNGFLAELLNPIV